jgi:uncharacterized membrane protein (DUF2068 family)
MYETIFTIDPAGMAHHRFVAMLLLGVVSLVSAGLVVRFGWRSWWAVIAAGIFLPTIVVLALSLGDAVPRPKLPLLEFILNVAAPLALLGLPAAAIGSTIGAMLRWLAHHQQVGA